MVLAHTFLCESAKEIVLKFHGADATRITAVNNDGASTASAIRHWDAYKQRWLQLVEHYSVDIQKRMRAFLKAESRWKDIIAAQLDTTWDFITVPPKAASPKVAWMRQQLKNVPTDEMDSSSKPNLLNSVDDHTSALIEGDFLQCAQALTTSISGGVSEFIDLLQVEAPSVFHLEGQHKTMRRTLQNQLLYLRQYLEALVKEVGGASSATPASNELVNAPQVEGDVQMGGMHPEQAVKSESSRKD